MCASHLLPASSIEASDAAQPPRASVDTLVSRLSLSMSEDKPAEQREQQM